MGKIFIRGNVERQENFESNILAVSQNTDLWFSTTNLSFSRPPIQPLPGRQRPKISLFGGILTVAIVENYAKSPNTKGPERTPEQRVLARLQHKSKLGNSTTSDEVEGLRFTVNWEPAKGAFGLFVDPSEVSLAPNTLRVVSDGCHIIRRSLIV
jgi:mediator of RNA polymerase II transcription subunit 14